MALRIHADECIDVRIVAGARRRGVDIRSAHDEQLLGASDERHLEHARETGRVILTADPDFLRMARQIASAGAHHPGVLFMVGGTNVGEAVRAVTRIAESLEPDDMQDLVEWLP